MVGNHFMLLLFLKYVIQRPEFLEEIDIWLNLRTFPMDSEWFTASVWKIVTLGFDSWQYFLAASKFKQNEWCFQWLIFLPVSLEKW